MNPIEKRLYDALRGNPKLKRLVRNTYQRAFDLVPRRRLRTRLPIVTREGFFFGFHDHTPFSRDNTKLLAHRALIPLRMPQAEEPVEIGYFDGPGWTQWHPVGESRAWLWHMGAKLQWCGPGQSLVFNDLEGERVAARIINLETGTDSTLADPVASVSPNGRWACGYSFHRVEHCMPGYGYRVGGHETPDDTLYRIDLPAGARSDIVRIADLAEVRPDASMSGARHFLTHAVVSPDSTRVAFLHRWTKENVAKRVSRLVTCRADGSELFVYEGGGVVSHIGWQDANHIVAYGNLSTGGEHYLQYRVREAAVAGIIGEGLFDADGHPSFAAGGQRMITDTYPDRMRRQHLYLFDVETAERTELAEVLMPRVFQSPNPFDHWSCDLHPRFDRTGGAVCFDAAYTGTRSLCTMDIS